MKASEYLESKRALLTRGHEYECACKVCMEFSEAVYNAKADELALEVSKDYKMEMKSKAAKWDDPQTQEILECDRIERKLIENHIGISYYYSNFEFTNEEPFIISVYPKKKSNISGRGRNKFEGLSKLEALQKAEKWLDGRGAE